MLKGLECVAGNFDESQLRAEEEEKEKLESYSFVLKGKANCESEEN